MNTALIEAMYSRVTGAGIDPHDYQRVMRDVETPADWAPACARAAAHHLASADPARRLAAVTPGGPGVVLGPSDVTRGEHLLLAARWSHLATLVPDADHLAHARAADTAAEAGFTLLEPDTRAITGADFTGLLRTPEAAVGTVLIVPGLDSSKDEFHVLADALVRRGVAVFAMNGPGQGSQLATSRLSADHPAVISAAIDALGLDRVGVVGLSLGGYYAAAAAAHDDRIAVAATVSGPFRLDWAALPEPVRDLMTRRAGATEAAQAVAKTVDLTEIAPEITCPLLVVDGADDILPGVTNGEPLARHAPHGRYLTVPGGDHLVGNHQSAWLPAVADHLTQGLA